MERYQVLNQIGDGAYGIVLLAIQKDTSDKVAVKRMKRKFYSWQDCLNLREVKTLRKLSHKNIVKLKEVIREHNVLNFIFEYLHANLYQVISERKCPFSENQVKVISYQLINGLAFMHNSGFFHRDIKPENLLCHNGISVIKIADFGLTRELKSKPPYTDYVSTRWYRSPEILLRSYNYSASVDIWASACVIFEVYSLRPLFPGHNEIDMIFKHCNLLGTPTNKTWNEGIHLAELMNFKWPHFSHTPFSQLLPNASSTALDFLNSLLLWDPENRLTATQALKHRFLKTDLLNHPSIKSKETTHNYEKCPNLDSTADNSEYSSKPQYQKSHFKNYKTAPVNIFTKPKQKSYTTRNTFDSYLKKPFELVNNLSNGKRSDWYKK